MAVIYLTKFIYPTTRKAYRMVKKKKKNLRKNESFAKVKFGRGGVKLNLLPIASGAVTSAKIQKGPPTSKGILPKFYKLPLVKYRWMTWMIQIRLRCRDQRKEPSPGENE